MDANKLIAHRGDNTNYPENSYAGIESALMAGALFIEFDVQMNADHSLVVFHDTNFKRTANNNASLFETTDEEMSKLSIHEPDRFGMEHYPTPVSFLDDILLLFCRFPEATALIEVKKQSLTHWGTELFMDKFLKLVTKYENQSIVISFSKKSLQYTQRYSKLRIGFIFLRHQNTNKEIAYQLNPDFLVCSQDTLPKERLWEGSWTWIVYSLNNILGAQKILNREDVDMIETDDIRLLLEN